MPSCTNTPCLNFGNPAKGGMCNSCSSGKAAVTTVSAPVDIPYPPALRALADSFLPAATAALSNFDAYPHGHRVTEHLYISDQYFAGVHEELQGAAASAGALAALQREGIVSVVCVCGEGPAFRPFEGQGLAYVAVHLSDGTAAQKRECCAAALPGVLRAAVPLLRAAALAQRTLLVHCAAGVNRSGSVVCALLMIERDCTLHEAYTALAGKRVVCQPSFHEYLSSQAFAVLARELRHHSAVQAAKAAIWGAASLSQEPAGSSAGCAGGGAAAAPAPSPSPSSYTPSALKADMARLDQRMYKNPLLGLALLQAILAGHPAAASGWASLHFLDDSAGNTASAALLLPPSNVHRITQGEGEEQQLVSLHTALRALHALPAPGLACFDWGGVLGGAASGGLSLAGGGETAALLGALKAAGWVLVCASADPNEACAAYNAVLLAAGAPGYDLYANGERVQQARVGAAALAAGGGGGDGDGGGVQAAWAAAAAVANAVLHEGAGAAGVLQGAAAAAGGEGGSSSAPSASAGALLPLLQWSVWAKEKARAAFESLFGVTFESRGALGELLVTPELLRGVQQRLAPDLADAVKVLSQDPAPFPLQ